MIIAPIMTVKFFYNRCKETLHFYNFAAFNLHLL